MAAAGEGTPTNDRLLYRIPEVARQLNVSRSKVYELLTSGALPSVRIHRTRLVRADDLRAFVDGLEPSRFPATRSPEATGVTGLVRTGGFGDLDARTR